MTKVERKDLLEGRKRMLKVAWSTASDDDFDEETNEDMPEGLKNSLFRIARLSYRNL